jgi:hypothetical protein
MKARGASKQFFFEKKNQKTFVTMGLGRWAPAALGK